MDHTVNLKLGGDGRKERQRIKSLLLLSSTVDEKPILFLRLTLEDSDLPRESRIWSQFADVILELYNIGIYEPSI